VSKEEQLRTLILRLTSLSFRRPFFSGGLEREFTEHTCAFRCKRQSLESSICLGIYVTAALIGQILAPHGDRLQFQLRFGLLLPALFVLNLMQWFRPAEPWIVETAILIASVIAGSSEILLHLLPGSSSGFGSHLVILSVMVFINTVMRLRFAYALASLGWSAVMEGFCIAFSSGTPGHLRLLQAALVMGISLLTVISNYSQNREARLGFLRYVQKRELVGDLAQSNQNLAAAALTDSLTGLANRACLDQHLAELWLADQGASTGCSIIMVDIDHFKDINDRYGHLYGDRVLKRVARLLSEALRGQDDFIARFGGEEFAVILPNTTLDLAKRVAERLRGLVELAGLPSLRTDDPDLEGMRATISCGVATGAPSFCSEPYTVLDAADEALYLAKNAGRNVVRDRALEVPA
jgi:diguanylate cyclase (GGDEF)-like protein